MAGAASRIREVQNRCREAIVYRGGKLLLYLSPIRGSPTMNGLPGPNRPIVAIPGGGPTIPGGISSYLRVLAHWLAACRTWQPAWVMLDREEEGALQSR